LLDEVPTGAIIMAVDQTRPLIIWVLKIITYSYSTFGLFPCGTWNSNVKMSKNRTIQVYQTLRNSTIFGRHFATVITKTLNDTYVMKSQLTSWSKPTFRLQG